MLKKLIKGVAWAVLLLALGVMAVWGAARLWPAPQAERDALRWLQVREAGGGHDGFAQLWLLRFDGPDERARQQRLADDVQRWSAGVPVVAPDAADATAYREVKVSARRCGERGEGCLAQVRADPRAVAAAHAGHAALHARIAALAAAEDFSSPFAPTADNPFPPMPALAALPDPLGAWALAHVQGDSMQAIVGLCSGIASGRALMARGDNLAIGMLGSMLVELNARVLADVLGELPAELAMPAACDAALPLLTAQEVSLCRPMQGEFALATGVMAQSAASNPWAWLVLDTQRTRLRMAPNYAHACDPANAAFRVDDISIPMPAQADGGVACLANRLGCALADISAPAMAAHADRGQDAAAMLRLLAVQRWLRQQPVSAAQALEHLPAGLAAQGRPVTLAEDGRHLQVPRRHRVSVDEAGQWLRVPVQAPSR